MQYNKNEFNKVNDKKVMKKVKKQWVVVSIATLAILGASAYGMTNTSQVVVHADTTGASGTSSSDNGNENQAEQQSSATSLGTADGSAGRSKATLSAFQSDYDAAYSSASTSASLAASNAGSSDFTANKSKASYANHQDAYDTAYSAASTAASVAASQKAHDDSVAASSSAVSAGISDYAKGRSAASNVGDVNQSTYNSAYSQASSGFYAALNSSTASGANTSDANYQAGSSYEAKYSAAISAAINDVVMSNGNNMASYSTDQGAYYSAAYAGAQVAINAYSNATQGNGTGTQDYNYYNNTANTSYTSGNGSTAAVKPNINTSNWGQGSSATYNASAAASYTGSYNDSYQANKGGADNPNDAYNSVISYENDLGLKFNNAQNTSVKINGQNATSGTANIKVASQSDVNTNNSAFYGALSDVYKYATSAALAKQGMVDAEKGKWTGVIGDGSAKGKTQDFYLTNNPNVNTSSTNPYDQGYLGAKAAIAAQFNGGNSVQSISAIDASSKQDKNYIAAYNDVVSQAAQNVVFVSTGKQFDGIMNNSTLLSKGFTIKLVNDIDLHPVSTAQENDVNVNSTDGKTFVIDGQNHIADMSGQQYKFNTNSTSNTQLYVQNFQTLYGTNYFGPFSLSNGGAIYYKNVNYVGSQILSAKGNYVYVDGNVNVFQRDDVYDSPFLKGQGAQGSGNQNNLSIANMVLNKGAHYFGSVGSNTGSNVVYISGGGNLTLGEDSSMTLIPRGNATGGDDGADQGPMGVDIQNGSLTVNKNANLNIMPDYSNTYPAYGAGGGIYVGSNGGVRVDGGRINIESNQSPKMYGQTNALLYVNSGSNVLATNGGTIQVKVAHISDNRAPSAPASGGGLVCLNGGTVQVANRGNLISAISDGSGAGVPLVYGNLIVNNSGDSHVILDAGSARNSNGNNTNPFVSGGNINAYTGKVNGKIYYNYQMNPSSQYTSTDQYLKTTNNTPYSGGQILDISSIPSVYFANPISAKTNSDGSITVSGIAKVAGYDGSDYAKQNVYLQFGIDKNSTTNYNDSGMTTFLTTDSTGKTVQYSNPAKDDNGNIVDNNVYSATSSSNVNQIPINFTIPANQANGIKTVGIYMRYGVNGIYMTATPSANGGSDYSSSIVGYSAGSNGVLSQDSAATVQVNSGKGQDITDGLNNAIADATNGTNSKDPLRYQKNNDYTGVYDSVMSGYKAATPQLLQQLGITDPTKAPTTLTPDLLAKIQQLPEYQKASNPSAFMQGLQQAYQDYLANSQAANDIANASPAAAASIANGSQDSAYKKNYAASYNTAQQALNDAVAGTKTNRPADTDPTGQQVYDKAQQQYKDAQQAMVEAAQGTTNNPNNLDPSAYQAGQTAYNQIVNDVRSGKKESSNDSPFNQMSPLQQTLYNQQYDAIKAKYDAGQQAALSGQAAPSDPQALAGYNDAKDGFNNAQVSDTEKNSPAYKAGQAAKTDEQAGQQAAMSDSNAQPTDKDSQAKKDGLQATKDAYAAASGQQAPLTADQLAQKSLPYQDAYKAAQNNANNTVAQAEADYKNGTTANKPQGNGVDAAAYKKVQNDAAAGANAASQPGSADTPDANQTPAYKMGYNVAKGSADALNGATKNPNNTNPEYGKAYDEATDGFNGANNTAPENQTAAYKAGQQAKEDSQTGADLATKGQGLPTTPAPSQAEQDGYQATKDAYDAAAGKKAPISDTDLAKKSLAYQDAYKKALAAAQPVVNNALADYKNGSTANQPNDPNSAAGQAYKAVKDDAAAGANAANQPNSADTPASDKTPAYKEGYNIAKGVSDAENAKQPSSTNQDPDYTNAYNNFNSGKAQGESAKPTDSAPANADQATKDGFAYGQGIAALKNAKNPEDPNASQGLTGKQLDGFNAAKVGYEAAMKGQPAPTAPAAAVEGYNYAKALTDGSTADKRPDTATGNDDLPTEQKAYDDTQAAVAQAKADIKAGKTGSQLAPSDGNANNKDVYDKAYAAAVKAYQNTDPTATAASAGIKDDVVGAAAFEAAKADGLKVQGAKAFTDGKANNQSDSNFTKGYNDAKQGYADALHDKSAPSNATDEYNTGAAAAANDKAGFLSAENGKPDDSDAAKGAAAAIAAVKAAKGKDLDSLPEINDSTKPASYNNAYNAALEDAKQAAKQGIASQLTPDSTNTQTPVPGALADVYKAAASDAQKGYAEGLTGKPVSDSNNASETQGNQKGASDKQKYEDALADFAKGITDPANASTDPSLKSDPVYRSAIFALVDASKGTTGSDNSPVYTVANSQALGAKDAQAEIAKDAAKGTDPQPITDPSDQRLAQTPAKDKQSYMNAYNDAIKGYNAGKNNTSDTATNNDPADQNAFNAGKTAGEAARGANDALNGKKSNDDVAADLTSNDPAKKSYAQGVTDANNGYAQGLNDATPMSSDELAKKTPAYQKAYAQGQADKAGVDAAKSQPTPDANNVPQSIANNKQATDAYKGYAAAIAAVKAAKGDATKADRPTDFDSQTPDFKAAYQKAIQDAVDANKAGQDSIANPSSAAARPSDPALAAVYDAAKHDTNKGMAEVLSGKQGNSDSSNQNEQAGIQAGTQLQAAYQAAAKDFAAGITDPTNATQKFSDPDQVQAYKDALAGMKDGSQTPASDQNDPKSNSPIYAIAKQQAQNVQNAVAAAQGSQNVADGHPNQDADLAKATGYDNDDNKPDMNDAYTAAANAYSDAINHTNGDNPTDQSKYSPADQMAYAQAYKAAKDAAAKGLTDFGNGNKDQQPNNPADKAAYNKAQSDALDGLNDGLANNVDTNKQGNNPAYKQGVDDAAAIKKAAEDAVNGTPDAGKSSLVSDAQKAAYDAIKPAADAGQSEYTNNPDKYAGKTGDALKTAANQAAQDKYPNDPLKQAAFAQAIESAGDAFGNGASAFGNGEQQPTGIAAAGYQAAQQAYNAATDGTGKPEKVNGHYPTPQGVTPSDQYDKTFDAAYDKYKAAVDNAAQDTAANGGTATKADDSNVYKNATPKEQAAYNDAATKAAKGIADAKLDDPTKDAQYGTTKDGKFVPNDDTAAQAYAGAKAGYADGKTGATNEPTNVSPAYKAAYDKANADAKAAAHAGVEDFAQGLPAAKPTEDSQAASDAHSNGFNQAAAGYQAAINNPSGDFSSNPDASYQKGVDMAKAAAAARDNVLNNGDNAQPTQGETSTDPDVQGAAKAAAAAAKAALADGKNGLDKVTNTDQVPDEFKPYAKIYADAYATVQDAATKAAQNGALNFASDGKEGSHNTDNNDKSVDAVANQKGYDDANKGYQTAQSNPDEAASSNSGSVNEDEAAKGAAAAFNDVAGKDNAKPGDHATSDNNPVYKAAYQKALAEGKENASDGAEALFNNNPNNSTANASTLAKPNATTAADKAFNKGLENAKNALADAQANDPSKDAQYAGNNADTDAGNVYHATQDAYNAVLNGQQPLTASQLASKDPVYAAAYKNALSHAQNASTNGATDTNDNGSSYDPNVFAKAVYEKARTDANKAYNDALANKDPELKDHNGIDKGSVAYQATQNAINDYLKNNGNAKEDPTAAGMDPANAQAYKAYYEKAKAAVAQAATDGVNAYLGGKAIDDVPSVEGDNTGLGQVAKEAAERAEKGHEDAVNNDGRVSDANQPIATDPSYLTGLKGAQDAAKGVAEAKADATKQPDVAAPQAEKDGFNGTVDGYNKAATDGSIKPQDIDAYIAANLGNKSIAYRDAFKNAYLDGLKVAKAGADAANANEPDATNGQNGAAQKAQSQGYKDATNAFLDKLHGVDDKDATSNTPSSVAGRQRASQYLLALQDVAEGHPNTGSTDPDYQKGLATAQAAVAQAVADAKANKQLPADLSQIPVPDGSDPVAYRDAYAGILSGFYNGYNSKSTDSGSTDAYYNIAFGIGYAKGKASIPTDTSAPSDFLNNRKMPTITDPAIAKAYKQQYEEAKSGFYDALYKRGSKSNNAYYKASYKLAQDGLAGMRLAAKGNTKANRDILKTKDASFVDGYNGYLKGIAAAKRTLKKNKKLSAKDLLNKDKLYSYTFKEGLKHEIKIQRAHGKKFGTRRALERFAIPKNIYTHHSESYARTYVATYKKEMKRHMPRYIYNVGTIFTHNHVKFTRHTRIRKYAYSARYNSTVFRVVGVKYYKNRIPRYRLSNGAVVTASPAVQNAYYKKHFKKYRVIKPTGVLIHTGKTFTKRNSVRRLYRGEVFHVRKVVKFHGITRLYVGKSAYITSNKTFVKAIIK
ncbi:DUF5776 domain-containing protein [Apilactobacillus kunkeei]|uniref:DUF5776 domain-containing protein n=1 Tax=Apilactobacillus kunkeei TaxID=148814 RepID=UPI00265B2650|nr:DUF5776 domain-containing protein [Apilactobacillus kunkeei]WJV43617.1 DUF5776 domain-containing protein [Apilactobacillus kunkeei]